MNRSLSDLISTVNRSLVWLFWISNDLTVGSYILPRFPGQNGHCPPDSDIGLDSPRLRQCGQFMRTSLQKPHASCHAVTHCA